MGLSMPGGAEQAQRCAAGAFSAPGASAGINLSGAFNFSLWGAFTGSASLERSFDGGTTWLNCSIDTSGDPNAFTAPTSGTCSEPESGVLYRVNCTALSAGAINWRLSQ